MTDQGKSPFISTEEFELKLFEFLHGPVFELQRPEVQATLKTFLGVAEDSELEVEVPAIDSNLVHQIAKYLIEDEELGYDIPAGANEEEHHELAVALRCGLFIYGWEESRGDREIPSVRE